MRNSYPLVVRDFSKSGMVKSKELLVPDRRYRCSTFIYPPCTRSAMARFTVDRDRDRSIAMLGRPALTVRVCSLYQIQIDRHCPAGETVTVNGVKPIHVNYPRSSLIRLDCCFFGICLTWFCSDMESGTRMSLAEFFSSAGSSSFGGYFLRMASVSF